MRLARFHRDLIDEARVTQAIVDAERTTSGEIRVSLAPFFWGSIEHAARRAFERLGMTHTRRQNGVLLFIVPSRRGFVVLGDTGIHERAGQRFWDELVGLIEPHFRRGEFTEGVLLAISSLAAELARHFPRDEGSNVNELPDEVDRSP
jgi:uncharacterized membrane protein